MQSTADALFAGPGDSRTRGRVIDWSTTPLGPVEHWSPSLRTAARLCLEAPVAMALWAGPCAIVVHNDRYAMALDPMGRCAMGRPAPEVLPEVWRAFEPELQRLLANKIAAGRVEPETQRLAEAGHATLPGSLTPVRDDDGQLVGVLHTIERSSARDLDLDPDLKLVGERNEVALRNAVERYERQARLFEAVVSTTLDFVYLFDLKGRFLYANKRLLEVWGMRLAEVRGKTCRELGYEQWHHDMHMREIAQVIETKSAIKGEVPFRAPLTGVFGVYEYIFTPVIGPDGEVELVAGTTRDVTERKRAEQTLRFQSEQFETLLNEAPLGVYLVDAQLRIVQVNPIARPVFGDIPELIGRDLDQVLHILWEGAYAEEVIRLFRHTLQTGESHHFPERREFRADRGVVEYYAWRVNRITLPHGGFGVVCYFSDVSEQVRARQAIAASEKRYRTLFESIDEGLAIVEVLFDETHKAVDYRFLETNPVFEHQTGLRDALGKTARHLVPDIESFWFDEYGRVASTGEPKRFESHSESMGRWFDVYAFRMGEPHEHHVALLFSDITDRKRRELNAAFLADVAEDLARLSSEEEILRVVGVKIGCYLESETCSFCEVDDVGEELRVVREFRAGRAPDDARQHRVCDLLRAELKRACRAGVLAVVRDTETDPRTHARSYAAHGVHAFVAVPFQVRGAYGHVLVITDCRARTWRKDELELVQELSNCIFPRLERAKVEKAFREGEERFRALATASSEVLYRMSPDWSETSLLQGPGFLADTAQPSRPWVDMCIHPDDRPLALTAIEDAIRTKGVFELEHRSRRPDGSTGWTLSRAVALTDTQGEILEWIGSAQDITSRKEAEEALRQSQSRLEQQRSRLQAIVDTIPVGLLILDPSGEVSLLNDEAKKIWAGEGPLTEVRDDTNLKGAWADSGAPLGAEDWPATRALRHGTKTKGEVVDIERLDGSRATIVSSAAPIRDAEGTIVGAVAVNQDITELREAKARLEEADERKNAFLAVLSHELRNPLAPIKNSLHVLERVEPGDERARRAKDILARQVDQLAHLVDDLLDVTRIANGKIQLQRRRLELNELVRRTVEDQRTLFEQSELEVRVELAPHPLYIDGDWHRVSQVLSNLLQNAAKFTQPGGWVGVEVITNPPGEMAVIRVTDNGAGMAPEVLARLFQPFMQADATLDRSKGGLGLGLALVKGLVEQHGGTVEAKSDGLGRGAEFSMSFPLDFSDFGAAVQERAPTSKVRRRVLVIEDNVDAAETLRAVLELDGHEVEVAHSGLDGVSKARVFHADVVLCDIGLPGMDGYEVARMFRADEGLRAAHLVALSGYTLAEDLQRAAEAGFERHLAKPPSLEKLERILSDLAAG